MPIYEYECTQCKYILTKIHGVKDTPTFVCNECQQNLVKCISAGHFKGSGEGWYGWSKGRKERLK